MACLVSGSSAESVPAVVPTATPSLTGMPTEVLVLIISYLDTRSMVHLRLVCRRLRTLTSDPINWSTISWVASSYIEDVNGLKFALKVSKGALRSLSLSSLGWHFHMSKFISQILSCRNLQSISLKNVVHTEKQISKLLTNLPNLTFLHLNDVTKFSFKALSGCQLKTLSFNSRYSYFNYIKIWSSEGYTPPNLLIQYRYYTSGVSVSNIQAILSLPPSTNHNAYLSVCPYTSEDFMSSSPCLQFQFTPNPSISALRSLPMVLTSDEPSCRKFSGGVYSSNFRVFQQWHLEFSLLSDIGHNLTSLNFRGFNDLKSDQLESWVQLLPNLVYLNLECCGEVLNDLKGLAAVNASCPKLKVLNLLEIKKSVVECLDGLWKILSEMYNLRVLLVPLSLIPNCDPIPMNLTAINIDQGDDITEEIVFIEAKLNFLTKMPSLKVFKCIFLQPATIFHGFSRLLSTSHLTHLSITLGTGSRLTLPTDSSCYSHLQQMFLSTPSFVFRENLANVLTQSKNLKLLSLRVASVDVKGITITSLVNSLKSLSVLYVCPDSNRGLNRTFAKSLTDMAKRDNRMIEINFKCAPYDEWFGY